MNIDEWSARYEELNAQLEVLEKQELEYAKQTSGMDEEEQEQEEEGAEVDAAAENPDGSVVKAEPEEELAQDQVAEPSSRRQPKSSRRAAQPPVAPVDGQMIQTLRLTKKYYADALRFIQQLEAAVPTLSQLLVSTNKAEALECMRFFRLAYEYNLQSAEVSGRIMGMMREIAYVENRNEIDRHQDHASLDLDQRQQQHL